MLDIKYGVPLQSFSDVPIYPFSLLTEFNDLGISKSTMTHLFINYCLKQYNKEEYEILLTGASQHIFLLTLIPLVGLSNLLVTLPYGLYLDLLTGCQVHITY